MASFNTERYYLRDQDGKTVKFLHIQQANADTIHMYIPGLLTKQAKLVKKCLSRTLSQSELSNARHNWADFEPIDPPESIKYISFHPKDMCFRFQLVSGESREQKFDMSHGLADFMDFKVYSDSIDHYQVVSKPKKKHSVVQVLPHQITESHGSFALGDSDVRDHPILGGYATAEARGAAGPVKMVMYGGLISLSSDVMASRPRGTICSVLFFRKDGAYEEESYILS